ncbi:protein FAM24A [Urocitellus parryii]|uniref:Protein FAM24A-like n=1 Tax=Urocitellus parryii TaxID=9999 RepID=A0A8D2H2R7_UROPR|nr:protein FAM24A-like [Urocitellus parryii]
MFDLKTKIIIGIGAGLLFAAIVLICVVLSLFFKVSSILKAAKECCPSKFQSKIIPPKGTMESCPALPCCDEYSLYADYDALPPCYCGTNEGL